ncbi:MAG TPA: hypothetical protein VJZ26_02730 [Blastocatellia bacterium]|nr:hypothetical protein [Blastocatellia bacterium]
MRDVISGDSRAGERGAVTIKTLLLLFVVACVVFVAVKFVPIYIEQRGVIYDVEELARIAAVRGWKEDKITPEITKIRGKYELPEGSINLTGRDQSVRISVGYIRAIDLLVTTYDWKVEHMVIGKEI